MPQLTATLTAARRRLCRPRPHRSANPTLSDGQRGVHGWPRCGTTDQPCSVRATGGPGAGRGTGSPTPRRWPVPLRTARSGFAARSSTSADAPDPADTAKCRAAPRPMPSAVARVGMAEAFKLAARGGLPGAGCVRCTAERRTAGHGRVVSCHRPNVTCLLDLSITANVCSTCNRC